MKKIYFALLAFTSPIFASAQCSTTNATTCQCLTSGQTNCDLLPDITVSKYAFETYQGGPNEYPQTNAGTSVTGQGPDDGRLRLTGSTPNTGVGPMEVRAVDKDNKRWFLCGTDTFSIYDPNATAQFTCPNGNPNPKQLLKQRVYHKSGSTMTYFERFAGTMTYHPTHSHYHVDDWEIMTLRIQDPNEPDPLKWPIVGTGHKVGFCIEDYQSCSTANGHCRDSANNILVNSSFPNYNLGGGTYSCGLKFQGITVGWTDIYWETLDGQWIDIAPGTCNGNYWVVIVVDPHNFFLESNEDNNYFAAPITLTQQSTAGNPVIEITTDNTSTTLCAGDSITLTATAGSSISWSTGETTQSIRVPASNQNYTVTVTNYCGTGTASYRVNQAPVTALPVVSNDTLCVSGNATLTASANGTVRWYDGQGNYLASGSSFTTPTISSTTTYYAENNTTHADTAFGLPHTNGMGAGDWKNLAQYLSFKALVPFTLKSVKVYANGSGTATIQLQDSVGNVIQTASVTVPSGMSRVNLNFSVPAGSYRLNGTNISTGLNLYRNNSSGVDFPYGVSGIVDITGCSAGASYYYYFYDWEVTTTASSCPSAKVPVTAVVQTCVNIREQILFSNSINIYPNPAQDQLTVQFESARKQSGSVAIMNVIGVKVLDAELNMVEGDNKSVLDISSLAKGTYLLSITYEGKPYVKKFIVD
jgi:hypothetical protein